MGFCDRHCNLNWFTCLIVLSFHSQLISCWQNWDYSSFTNDDWKDIWGFSDGPAGRRGHSMVLWDESKIILFGGRGNEVHRPDVPKTFDLIDDEGYLQFTTYDEKPVRSNYDPSSCQPDKVCVSLNNAKSGNAESCSYSWDHVLHNEMNTGEREQKEEQCGFATSGTYYNDIWFYDLACTRFGDGPCVDDGWRVMHPGAKFGGCKNEDGSSLCDTPFARWGHSAIMIDSSTMLLYGGYGQECEDFCDDMWIFDLNFLKWQRLQMDSNSYPSKRWKFSMIGVSSDSHNSMHGEYDNVAFLFGGHRLWHGFTPENSEVNNWESYKSNEVGGYLNDLWILKMIDNSTTWTKIEAKETCLPSPGFTWNERNDITCKIYWPKERSGHAAVFDEKRNGFWIHGGFTSHYPYPSSSSSGSGEGVKETHRKGFIPFASHSYYLNDLWFYNISSGYWKEMKQRNLNYPSKRQDHILILTNNILILHGGYSDNLYYNDTWYYYIDENRWLQKKNYVHIIFPDNCTDDVAIIKQEPNCIELSYPPPLQKSAQTNFSLNSGEIFNYQQQPGYTPDLNHPLYFGIVDDAEKFVASLRRKYLEKEIFDDEGNRIWIKSDIPDGTPIAPHAATGPGQYAQLKRIQYNVSSTIDIWEWCTTVAGEPTRDKVVDGFFGRANESIYFPQLRRMSPGWDGCQDFRWKYPPSRSDHKGVYVEKYSIIFIFGGLSYKNVDIVSGEHPSTPTLYETHETLVKSDLWVFGIHNCPKNCSSHGICTDGFCHCFPGFYGLDCSNVTCPGSVCYYDKDSTQHCTHCCYDGYIHTDEERNYAAGIRKLPCQQKGDLSQGIFTGTSNGICDGFGNCQCAPPFLGEDCSIRDCLHDCSFNGYCSLEFPNSRCICNEGYFGEYCQFLQCPNNCTYPNGICDHSSGICSCRAIFSPYNHDEIWTFWQGHDCSYLTPWCGCSKLTGRSLLYIRYALGIMCNLLFVGIDL